MVSCRRLTIMMMVADRARADVTLTADRIYYRFATEESIEDGELPPAKESFDKLAANIIETAKQKEGETPLAADVKVSIFIDNRLSAIAISEQSLKRLIGELITVAQEFTFLNGFC